MVKDERYVAVHSLFESGRIQTFADIFKYLPKTVLARDIKQNYSTFASKVAAPDKFTVKEIARMSALIEVPHNLLFASIIADLDRRKKSPN